MAEDFPRTSQSFPVKPNLKSTSLKSTKNFTPEAKYWKTFKSQPTPKTLISSITSLSFSPDPPHLLVATLFLFSPLQTLEQPKSIISLSDTTTSASFRSDGRLVAAGSLSGLVQVFDVKTRTPLRRLRAHSRPVHLARYPRSDKLHLFFGGDDAVVRYCRDVASETSVSTL